MKLILGDVLHTLYAHGKVVHVGVIKRIRCRWKYEVAISIFLWDDVFLSLIRLEHCVCVCVCVCVCTCYNC